MKTISLFQGNIVDYISPLDYSNPKRYHNYMAIIEGLSADGKEIRTYLREMTGDLYFNTNGVKAGDILKVNCWDERKSRQYTKYYNVININDECLTLDDGHSTYRKAFINKPKDEAEEEDEVVAKTV